MPAMPVLSWKTARGGIDIVLAEVKSGEPSGLALASWVRTHLPNTSGCSGRNNRHSRRKGWRHLPRGTALSKPYDHRLVLDYIQRLLAARDRQDRT
jgi:hypothetical protein